MRLGLSPLVFGFVLLGLLPGLLGLADMALLGKLTFVARLSLWNQSWLWLSLGLIAAFVIDFRRAGQRWVAVSKLDFVLVGLLLMQAYVLAIAVAANPALANLHLLRILAALAVGVASYYAMRHYGNRFSNPTYGAIILGMVLTIPALLYFIYFVAEARTMGNALKWQMPGVGPVRVYGAGLEAALVVGLAILIGGGKKRLWVKAILLGAVLCLWAIVFWSGARGGVLSILVAAVALSVVRPQIAVRLWLVLLATGVAGAGLSLLIWTPDIISFGLWNMFDKSLETGGNKFASLRLERWRDSLGLIAERGWFGHGLSQFSNLWPDYRLADQTSGNNGVLPLNFLMYRHLHNVVLDAFLALGLVGGSAFIVLSVRGLGKAIYRVRQEFDNARLPALFGLLTLLAHSFLTGIYVYPQTLLLVGLFFGIGLAPNPAQNVNTNG